MPTLADVSFVTDSHDYSLANAYWLARAAQIAYSDGGEIEPQARGLGLTEFAFLQEKETQGFVAADDKAIIVSFRGTEPDKIQDLLADARLHKVDGPFGEVHRGFQNAFLLVKDDMYAAIDKFRNADNPQPVFVTGHSLGGALAVMATAYCLTDDRPVDGLYTFGQPRVGNEDFVEGFKAALGSRHFRFVNNNDTVTRVPPRVFGYAHTGDLRHIEVDGDIVDNPGRWTVFLDRVRGRFEDLLQPGTDGIKDHSMDRYVAHIANALGVDAE